MYARVACGKSVDDGVETVLSTVSNWIHLLELLYRCALFSACSLGSACSACLALIKTTDSLMVV